MQTSDIALARPIGIAWAGLLCGILDITAAFIAYGCYGLKPVPLLQGIAAGLLGQRAWEGGLATGPWVWFVIL